MMWPSHALLGISSLWLLAAMPADVLSYDFGTLAVCATFGALLPDLDAWESKIKHLKILGTSLKPFHLPAQVVHHSDQHRGLLHSLLGLGMITLFIIPVAWWTGWAPVVALLLGYASHLMADAATKSGLLLLFPSPQRFYLLPQGWRITTGSLAEDVLLAPLSCAVFGLLLLHLPRLAA